MSFDYVEGDRILVQCSNPECYEIYSMVLSADGPEILPPCPACDGIIDDNICVPIEGTFPKLIPE